MNTEMTKIKINTDEEDNYYYNEELIIIKSKSGIKNNDIISRGTGIDKSTVSLHFSGKRLINVDQAKLYANFFQVPIQRVLDSNKAKYRIIGYLDEITGVIKPSDPFKNVEIVICENDMVQYNDLAFYSKLADMLFWFQPDINSDNMQVEASKSHPNGRYCYIDALKDNKEIKLVGDIRKRDKKDNVEVFNRHSLKLEKYQLNKAYPISTINFLEFSKIVKTSLVL
tara:strand:+ start:142 stop:819 length:678 start_codon:yes stop_codon:yes gene_type:complete